jgi:hypothetical protein
MPGAAAEVHAEEAEQEAAASNECVRSASCTLSSSYRGTLPTQTEGMMRRWFQVVSVRRLTPSAAASPRGVRNAGAGTGVEDAGASVTVAAGGGAVTFAGAVTHALSLASLASGGAAGSVVAAAPEGEGRSEIAFNVVMGWKSRFWYHPGRPAVRCRPANRS